MLDIEKCKRYFEIEDQNARIAFRYQIIRPKVNSQLREFLRLLGLIEYELIITYNHECNYLHTGIN